MLFPVPDECQALEVRRTGATAGEVQEESLISQATG